MPVPSTITDLSATAASNSPAATDAVFPDLDNYLRAHAALIRQGDAKASDIASATTTSIGAAAGRIVDVTGTTTITSFGTVAAGVWRIVRFTGALTITHNGSSLILPGAANITTAAGDSLIAVSLGSGNWYVAAFTRAAGDVVLLSATQTLANKTISGSSNTLSNIANASLTNSSVTIGSTSVALGATAATVAGLTLTTPTIASITNGGTVTVPTGTDTLVNLAGTQTLSNKTLAAAVGSASAPTHTFTGRTSDGVYSPASGQVAIATGGSERLLVTSDGLRVGGADYLSVQPTFRNRIINGGFDIWQRGTSQTSVGYGSDDRWYNTHVGSTKTVSRQEFTLGQTAVPGEPRYFSRTVVTNVAGAGNYVGKQHRIESVRTFAGQSVTLSFWAKADASKSIAIDFSQSFGLGGSPSSAITGIGAQKFNLTTSWQKFAATISIPSISGKTLGTDGRDWLELTLWFDAGSDWNSRAASLGQQSGTFDIALVQVEAGSVATPFESRPPQVELALCQRYYEEAAFVVSTTTPYTQTFYKVTKRAIPDLTLRAGNLQGATLSTGGMPLGAFRQETIATTVDDAFISASAEL